MIQKFIFFFLIFFLNSQIYAQSWPSLYEQDDFIPLNKKDESANKKITDKNIQKMSQDKIRKKVFDSFYFIADYASDSKNVVPRQWIEPKLKLNQQLLLGSPAEILRPNQTIYFPLYPISKLGYFKGNDEFTAEINICQDLWLQKRYNETFNCFIKLQVDISKNKLNATALNKLNIDILQAFLLLHILVNKVENIGSLVNGKNDNTVQSISPNDMYGITRTMFVQASNRTDDSIYTPQKKVDSLFSFYSTLLRYPQYFKAGIFYVGKPYEILLSDEFFEPLQWIQTVMPIVYSNTVALNQGVVLWPNAFAAAEKIPAYMDKLNFPEQDKDKSVTIKENALVTDEIFLTPRNNTDLLSSIDLFSAHAYQIGKEPDTALTYLSKGILRKGDPQLTSLMFQLSAESYFDLNILPWARRSYSWSELFSKDYAHKVPSSLFFGAESAFWIGHYQTARRGFQRFLNIAGDPQYSPWAELRLAEIKQHLKDPDGAIASYEKIIRYYPKHPSSQDAQVRLFCAYVNSLKPNARKIEYKKVEDKIETAREELKKQAKTCMLEADLISLQENSFKSQDKNVVEKSDEQIKSIDKYKKQYPESEFLNLFSERIKELNLSQATFLASKNSCDKLIDFYKKNKIGLKKLAQKNHHFAGGLKWDETDRKKLLRCSALVGNIPLWKEAKNFDIGSEGNPLQDIYLKMVLKPSTSTALKVYSNLKKESPRWLNKLGDLEKRNTDVIERSDFWEMLALNSFLDFEFTATTSAKELLDREVVRDLILDPSYIFKVPLFCSWVLRSSKEMTSDDWDKISQTKSQSEWVSLINNNETKDCVSSLAKTLLVNSMTSPSLIRDKNVIFPYLEKKGYSEGAQEWLSYAQRLENTRGAQDSEVQNIYRNLFKNSKDNIVKESSRLWLKKNLPDSADKMLW